MKINLIILTSIILVFTSCQNKNKEESESETTTIDTLKTATIDTLKTDSIAEADYQKETTNEETATKIKIFLKEQLKNDLAGMDENDRKFSFYEVDLNDDHKNEYFISLEGRYFCGSGGCSFYLLNNDFSINTYFTVTSAPFFISSQKTNGWHDLILKGDYDQDGVLKNFTHLKYNSGKRNYPSNPSLIKKTDIAPSSNDFILWDENFSKAKTFTF